MGGEEAREDPLRGLLGSRLQEGAGAPPVAGGEAGAAGEGPVAAGGGAEAKEALGRQAREDLLQHADDAPPPVDFMLIERGLIYTLP